MWEGGEEWLVCVLAAPETPGLDRYIPSPDSKCLFCRTGWLMEVAAPWPFPGIILSNVSAD